MLPSKGYFKSLNCPYYDNGFCDRPHCHFRHTKRDKTADEFSQFEELEENQQNEYNKNICNLLNGVDSEGNDLVQTHDVKSVWLVQQPSGGIGVSYKPTPIAELKKRHIPISSAPSITVSHSNKRRIQYDVKEIRKPKVEYVPEALNTNQAHYSVDYSSGSSMAHCSQSSYSKSGNQVYKATKIPESPELKHAESESSNNINLFVNRVKPFSETSLLKNCGEENSLIQGSEESEDEIDFDQVSSELNFLDEILKEYDNTSEKKHVKDTNLSVNPSDINIDKDSVKSLAAKHNNDGSDFLNTQVLNGSIIKHQNPLNKENKSSAPKTDVISSNESKKCKEGDNKISSIQDCKNKTLGSDNDLNKLKQSGKNDSTSKVDSTKSNHKSSSSNHRRRSSDHKKVEKTKSDVIKKKIVKDTISNSSDKLLKEETEDRTVCNKIKTIDLDCASSSSIVIKKEHSKSSNKSSKNESEHKSNSTVRKESHSRSSSSKSKKVSDHKSTSEKSSKKESDHLSSITKSSNREENSSPSKKRRLGSPESRSIVKHNNKEESKTKHKSEKSKSIGHDRNSSKNKEKVTDVKKRERSSSSKENHKRRDNENGKMQKHSHSNNHKTDTESDKTDDEVEIISNPGSIIVIDSEEELNTKEVFSSRDGKKVGSRDCSYSSPTHSPIFPSDDSDESDIVENTPLNVNIPQPTGSRKTLLLQDDNSLLDHRVKHHVKTRVSLGSVWRPAPKKPVELLTPAKRLQMFRKLKEAQEKEKTETQEAAGKVRIGCVPNVKLLLQEKERLLKMAVPKVSRLSLEERPAARARRTEVEDKDAPPLVLTNKVHPQKRGADKYAREEYMAELYKVARQLVKPGDLYRSAQNQCQSIECETWITSDHHTYAALMKKQISMLRAKIPEFTLQNYYLMTPKRSSLFPPELRTKITLPGGGTREEEVSIFKALKPHLLHEDILKAEGYPHWKDKTTKDLATIDEESIAKWNKGPNIVPKSQDTYICINCSKEYQVGEDGRSLDRWNCNYHPKKNPNVQKTKMGRERTHRCCNKGSEDPCMSSQYHSRETADPQNMEGFVETDEPEGEEPEEGWGVYAVDCEMYWSTAGLELGRVTVVNVEQRVVYDTHVRPTLPVTDYCTKMSGLDESILESRVTFAEVQMAMKTLFNSKTILIGHSLENDLKVLKLIHNTVVDTALVYKEGDRKQALKMLAKNVLLENIQRQEDEGHDSAEDAITCLKLMKVRLIKECQSAKAKAPAIRCYSNRNSNRSAWQE